MLAGEISKSEPVSRKTKYFPQNNVPGSFSHLGAGAEIDRGTKWTKNALFPTFFTGDYIGGTDAAEGDGRRCA